MTEKPINCNSCRYWAQFAPYEGFCDNTNSTHCSSITDACFTCADHKEHPDAKPSPTPK